ncbi:MAG: aldehyde dehydrogenase family protein [Bacteroidetes bacterium]|nr:aldehyde dehydrogenase family protein [Bacteroidota bacterium]MCH8523249.1 aldehyde dehydrogenase family protein [Balneolales bacterium]
MQNRIPVLKTYKIYIAGKFERSESGRYYALKDKSGNQIANICLSSRKDFRNAVVSARNAFAGWSAKTAYNRSQILYRMAEMMEGRSAQFTDELMLEGLTRKAAETQVAESIDCLIYYAGWCDKYQQVFGSVNPVASSHFNFSVPEPVGVVSIIAPEMNTLIGLVTATAPVIASGNTCVVLASQENPLSTLTFTEVLGTSDLPGGVINILTGKKGELLEPFSNHMDVNAVAYHGDDSEERKMIQQNAALNVRRVKIYDSKKVSLVKAQNPYRVMDFTEIKTTWHPIGE